MDLKDGKLEYLLLVQYCCLPINQSTLFQHTQNSYLLKLKVTVYGVLSFTSMN
uniref:Uncharacterized protein n=1 Tax=Rhizophora mucronata TaxID=61149 RepID=A0A2P2IM55_RHIMU